jgi:hypothetical protein
MEEKASLKLIDQLDHECVARSEESWTDLVDGFWALVKQRMYPNDCDYQHSEFAQEFKSSLSLRDAGETVRQKLLDMFRERLLDEFANFVDERKHGKDKA